MAVFTSLLLLLISATAQYVACERIYIVSSTASNCPQDLNSTIDQCLTIQQYASGLTHATRVIRDDILSLEMEPGNHRLESPISLSGISNNSFKLESINDAATISCSREIVNGFYVQGRMGVGRFHTVRITGVNFIGCDQNVVYDTNELLVEDVNFKFSRQSALALTNVLNATIIRSSISNLMCFQPTGFCSVLALSVTRSALNLNDCSIINGPSNSQGGGILSDDSDLIIKNSFFRDISGNTGGALRITNSRNRTLEIINSTFYGNTARVQGGAIYISGSDVAIKGCTFTNNTANGYMGGGIFATGPNISLSIMDSEFNRNTAVRSGGAVFIADGITSMPHIADRLYPYTRNLLTITGSNFRNNKAQTGDGGAVAVGGRRNSFSLTHSNFFNNSAFGTDGIGRGGAMVISSRNSSTLIDQCLFTGNQARTEGGAIYVSQDFSVLFVSMSSFVDNAAEQGSGGAIGNIFSVQNTNITIEKSIFNGNNASFCGALDLVEATIKSSTFTNNRANLIPRSRISWRTLGGGAICVRKNSTLISNSTFCHNIATNSSGGVLNTFTGVRIENSSFEGNRANRSGGVILHHWGNLTITSSNFMNNQATRNGGVVFGGSILIENATFINNAAEVGGTLVITRATITSSNFMNNQATRNGGVVRGTSVLIENADFINNAAEVGGTLFIGHAMIKNTNFVNNQAMTNGGAVYFGQCSSCDFDPSYIFSSNFTNNRARIGGGLVFTRRNIILVDNIFSDNSASSCGVLEGSEYNLTISSNFFVHNRATWINNRERDGSGGVMCLRSGTLSIEGSQFIRNTAEENGGVMEIDGSVVRMEGTLFDHNTANSNGGVSFTSSLHRPVNFEVIETDFSNNQAVTGDGGVFYLHSEESSIHLIRGNLSHNSAGHYGGLISIEDGSLTLNATTILNNTAEMGDIVSSCDSNITISNGDVDNVLIMSERGPKSDCFFYDFGELSTVEPSATVPLVYSTTPANSIVPSKVSSFTMSEVAISSFDHSVLVSTESLANSPVYTFNLLTTTSTTAATKSPVSVTPTISVSSTILPRETPTTSFESTTPPLNTSVVATINSGMRVHTNVKLILVTLYMFILTFHHVL